jgi:hypothetical protein
MGGPRILATARGLSLGALHGRAVIGGLARGGAILGACPSRGARSSVPGGGAPVNWLKRASALASWRR